MGKAKPGIFPQPEHRLCILIMYRRVMDFDFDGTLGINGDVPPEVETALKQCRASGQVLFLVTGWRFETVALGQLITLSPTALTRVTKEESHVRSKDHRVEC